MNASHLSFYRYLKNLGLNESVLHETLSLYTTKTYQKGEAFSRIGETNDCIGFITKGLFFMESIHPDGYVHIKAFLKNPQFLLSVFKPGSESSVTIKALTESIVLEAPYSTVCQLLEKWPEMARLSKQRVEMELEIAHSQILRYATMNASERYIHFLQEFHSDEAHIPQHLIASHLGITPTQLSRIRKEYFKKP